MNKIKNLIYLLGLSIVMVFTGCSEPDDEVLDIDYARLFTPTNLKTNVINRTQVRMEWTSVKGADSYTIEAYANPDLNFEGTPEMVITGVTENPYIIVGLEGDTQYSIRFQAVSETTPSSKWVSFTATTATEQIFETVKDEDLTATGVTLRWPAGETATQIVITPGDITHTITSAEIAAGAVTISGLTGSTKYTATLLNGSKVRGTVTFTTPVDLGGAIGVEPEDDLVAILSAANDGDKFALYPGTYGTSTRFVVNKNIQILAVSSSDKPVISGLISIEDGASLLMRDIILDGTGNESNQAIIFNTASVTYGALTIESCEIRNHDKGLYYLNVASTVESITIDKCLIHGIVCNGGDFMDSRVGAIKTITLSNSTVYNSCAARDFIRYDNASANFPGISPVITVSNCTLNGICTTADKRIFYVRFTGNSIVFKDNLVTNSSGVIFSDQASTDVPSFSNNNYFGAPCLFSSTNTSTKPPKFFDDSASNYDPQYANAANGDFTVGNTNNVFAGDPRWLP